jgi:hypothetical protein
VAGTFFPLDPIDASRHTERILLICAPVGLFRRGLSFEKQARGNQSMPSGGARQGAGRPKGAPNKASVARAAEIAASGETPLQYMLRVMRDPMAEHPRRDEMAKAAAPYVHPKLAAIEMEVGAPGDFDRLGPDELRSKLTEEAKVLGLLPPAVSRETAH